MFNIKKKQKMITENFVRFIAEKFLVKTPTNSLVLFSVSYQPTLKNKQLAQYYVAENPRRRMRIDDTPCGKRLIELGLENSSCGLDERTRGEIWDIVSNRLIAEASGNVTAFVDGADDRSTFIKVELPAILANNAIKTVNGEDKFHFASRFEH